MPRDAAHHVTAGQYAAVMRAVALDLDDEGLGLFSRKLRQGSFDLIARAALAGPSLADALKSAAATLRLLQDDLEPQVVRGDVVRFEVRAMTDLARQLPFSQEFVLRVVWRLLAWLQGGYLRAETVDLAIPQPAIAPLYRQMFPTDITFGADSSAIGFSPRALAAPVRRDEVALKTYLRRALLDILVPCVPTRVSDRVRTYLKDHQEEWPDLERTASALHLSVSSLQRHLAQEDTSFQAIRDKLRRDWAVFRLRTSKMSTLAIADELGFSDAATFQRAFKRWTGQTPAVVRRGGAA